MKIFKSIMSAAAVAALLALGACSESEKSDEEYASSASISSTDGSFTATSGGGNISFGSAGGSVVVNVTCGTDWTASYKGLYWVSVQEGSNSLTVTAEANDETDVRTGSITLSIAASGVEFATINVSQDAYGTPEVTLSSSEWNAPAVGALTTEIEVVTDADWKVGSVSASWLTAVRSDDVLVITAGENGETEARSGSVVLAVTDWVQTYEYTVTVNQDAHAYISVASETVELAESAGSETVAVESNFDWGFSYDETNGWLTVTASDDGLVLTVTDNTESEARTETVTLTAGDGAENTVEVQLEVIQHYNSPMILEYTVSSSQTVKLPLAGTIDCTVDWGDGTTEHITSAAPTHTYSSAGKYDVKISGTMTALNGNSAGLQFTSYITAVKQWGRTGLTDMTNAFYFEVGISSIAADTEGSFSEVTTFSGAFVGCSYITSIPSDLFKYATKATDFYQVFCQCTYLTTIPEDLFYNCTEVTTFEGAFSTVTAVTYFPPTLFDHCLKVINFKNTFFKNYKYTGESPYTTLSDGTKVHLYERAQYADQMGCVVPEEYTKCYNMCTAMSDYDAAAAAGWTD